MAISEFQWALIGAGAVAVAGVWAYNAWQEQRQRKAAEKIFRGAQQDVLVTTAPEGEETEAPAFERVATDPAERMEPRIEPVFSLPREEEIAAVAFVPDAAPLEGDMPAASAQCDAPGEDCLDPMIEVGMAFSVERSVAEMYSAWREAKVEFRKCIRWIGRDSTNGEWIEIANPATSRAKHAHVAIQLADRQGAIDIKELAAFCSTAEAIVVAQGGQRGMPALDEIIAHARAIDELCAAVDIQIAIHMVGSSSQAFAGTKLRGLLEACGLQLARDGMFYLLDGDGHRLFSVCNAGALPFDPEQMRSSTTSDVTFWLDVPHVVDGAVAFDTMLTVARQLAEALDGVLVDEQRMPLTDTVLAGIRAKVIELQTRMASHGIPAGGHRAQRLFV